MACGCCHRARDDGEVNEEEFLLIMLRRRLAVPSFLDGGEVNGEEFLRIVLDYLFMQTYHHYLLYAAQAAGVVGSFAAQAGPKVFMEAPDFLKFDQKFDLLFMRGLPPPPAERREGSGCGRVPGRAG